MNLTRSLPSPFGERDRHTRLHSGTSSQAQSGTRPRMRPVGKTSWRSLALAAEFRHRQDRHSDRCCKTGPFRRRRVGKHEAAPRHRRAHHARHRARTRPRPPQPCATTMNTSTVRVSRRPGGRSHPFYSRIISLADSYDAIAVTALPKARGPRRDHGYSSRRGHCQAIRPSKSFPCSSSAPCYRAADA